ncbi:MAG: cobalt ABC transporter ATP-binding protein, partial [Leuconostoc gelidum]
AVQRTKYRILSYQKIDKMAFIALGGFVIVFFVIKEWLHG